MSRNRKYYIPGLQRTRICQAAITLHVYLDREPVTPQLASCPLEKVSLQLIRELLLHIILQRRWLWNKETEIKSNMSEDEDKKREERKRENDGEKEEKKEKKYLKNMTEEERVNLPKIK